MSNLLDVESLSMAYPGGLFALREVSFGLRPGEALGIVGESGAGKTTLIRSLVNLSTGGAVIVGGRLLFEGQNTGGWSQEEWRRHRGGRAAMIFQNPGASLAPMVTVRRQFVEAIRNHNAMTKKEAEALALEEVRRLHLKDPESILAARPWQLSGGMKQRVAIGLTLAMNPDLILADEPVSALDVATQETIIEALRVRRRERNTAIIMVSHNICACARVADRILVMRHGRIVDEGVTEAILARSGDTYSGQLLHSVSHLKGVQFEKYRQSAG